MTISMGLETTGTLLAQTAPAYADNALAIAKNAAKFLIDHARKPDEKLAYTNFVPKFYGI